MFKLLTIAALVTTAGVVLPTASAFAKPAEAISSVNVRDEAGLDGDVIDTLSGGETVEVIQCIGGWCFVEHSGPDGWVSADYLTAAGDDEDEVDDADIDDVEIADEEYESIYEGDH